jgi:hypothetical protein
VVELIQVIDLLVVPADLVVNHPRHLH